MPTIPDDNPAPGYHRGPFPAPRSALPDPRSAFRAPGSNPSSILDSQSSILDPLTRWLGLPWPPGFFVPGCFCCGGSAQGYSCGGGDAFLSTMYATADRTTFATELTSAVSSANLTQARASAGSAGNPDVAGYFCGGRTTSTAPVATADKLSFATETTAAATGAILTQARHQLAGVSERSTKAYFAGGQTGTPGVVATTDKLTFATDTTSAQTTANLTQARSALAGLTEGTTKGYWAGGFTGTPAISTIVRTADRVTFSSDATAAMTSADLITAVSQCESGSNGVKGYWAGGQTGIGVLNCDKTTFSTDTTTAQTSAGIQRHFGSSPSGLADGTTLIALGGVDSVGLSASGHKITFATDIATNLGSGANLTTARQALAGLSTVAL